MESEHEEPGEDQALLILYLSGELSEDQHAALERRLEVEEPLRRELEGLRAAQAMIWREMLAADSAQPLRGVASTAHRKLGGMVRQWAVQRLAKEPPPAVAGNALRRWGIAVAAAAAVMLGAVLYSNLPQNKGETLIVSASNPEPLDQLDSDITDELFVSVGLSEVEQELDELVQLRSLTQ